MAKMINVDELIEFCNTSRSMLHERYNSVACAALRGVVEFAKEYAVEVESVNGGWISVKDRLPPYGERVLVVNEAYEAKRGYTKYNCGVTVRDPHLDFTFWGHKVTHWQPLPGPPKGE